VLWIVAAASVSKVMEDGAAIFLGNAEDVLAVESERH